MSSATQRNTSRRTLHDTRVHVGHVIVRKNETASGTAIHDKAVSDREKQLNTQTKIYLFSIPPLSPFSLSQQYNKSTTDHRHIPARSRVERKKKHECE